MSNSANIYCKFKSGFKNKLPKIFDLANKHKDKIKFIVAGGTAASSDFALLFLLHGVLEINVVVSAVMAFGVAFFISFYLQKFWTFRDDRRDVIYKQMFFYLLVAFIGIMATAVGIYILVEKYGVWYIFAQAMVGMSLAIGNFLAYKLVIFRKKKKAQAEAPGTPAKAG